MQFPFEDATSMKVLAQNDDVLYHVMPGDTVAILYTDGEGVTHTLESVQIDKTQRIDTVRVIEFTNAFGLASGLAAVVGAKHQPEPKKVGWLKLQEDPHLPAMLPNIEIDGLTTVKLHY